MNVINKMVIIPEKEYNLLRGQEKQIDETKPDGPKFEQEHETSTILDDKKSAANLNANISAVKLNEIKDSFKKAVQKYEKKLSKRPVKRKQNKQSLKWTNVKNF